MEHMLWNAGLWIECVQEFQYWMWGLHPIVRCHRSRWAWWQLYRWVVFCLSWAWTFVRVASRLCEHWYNLEEFILEKLKLTQHVHEKGKLRCLTNSISQPKLKIFPIWIILISNDLSKSWGRSAWCKSYLCIFIRFYCWGYSLYSTNDTSGK
jgi:hypothetical protein